MPGYKTDVLSTGGVELVESDLTRYVRTDGNDDNDGSANDAEHAFLTIQAAINYITHRVIPAGVTVTIMVANGTYTITTAVILGTFAGGGAVVIQGNTATPASVVLTTISSPVALFYSTQKSNYTVQGFRLQSTAGTRPHGLWANGGSIKFGAIDFGAGLNQQLKASSQASLECVAAYTISGAGGNSHIAATSSSLVNIPKTCVLTGTLSWVVAFCDVGSCSVFFGGTASGGGFSGGTVTGNRYRVQQNSLLDTFVSGANFFPGNAAGSALTGGIYA